MTHRIHPVCQAEWSPMDRIAASNVQTYPPRAGAIGRAFRDLFAIVGCIAVVIVVIVCVGGLVAVPA